MAEATYRRTFRKNNKGKKVVKPREVRRLEAILKLEQQNHEKTRDVLGRKIHRLKQQLEDVEMSKLKVERQARK